MKSMSTAQSNGQAPREELDRVLSSACFAKSEGLSRLLRFLVERQLEGRETELKESLIGVEVYGRRPDYDPKLDSTVRSEVARLRARLSKYYSTEGSRDLLVIDLPKGGYVPGFRQPEPAPARRKPVPDAFDSWPAWQVSWRSRQLSACGGLCTKVRLSRLQFFLW